MSSSSARASSWSQAVIAAGTSSSGSSTVAVKVASPAWYARSAVSSVWLGGNCCSRRPQGLQPPRGRVVLDGQQLGLSQDRLVVIACPDVQGRVGRANGQLHLRPRLRRVATEPAPS